MDYNLMSSKREHILNLRKNGVVDICVVTFNRLDYLKRCVDSIIASTKIAHRITVIDDISDDGTKEWLMDQKERGLIHNVIINKHKLGTAHNFNVSIRSTESEWVVMCNDDMYFHRGWDFACFDIINKYDDCGVVSFFNYRRFNRDEGVERLTETVIKAKRTGLGAAIINRDVFNSTIGFMLPASRIMGFFASNWCLSIMDLDHPKTRLYATIPHYATHMDETACRLYIPYKEYNNLRSRNKYPNKYR